MKKIRNFNLSYVSRDAAQYDARLLDENDVVAARYRRYDGYENNPNICALPERRGYAGTVQKPMPFPFRDMTADWFQKWGRKKGRGSCLESRM